MISSIKKGATIFIALLVFGTASAQVGTKVLTIDSLTQLEPIIMMDTTDFYVEISVDDTSIVNSDSITGDLFYYYQTDSMMDAGAPPRIINIDTNNITINSSISDIVSIDIRPDEIRTDPVNLIILWPAMYHPIWPQIHPELADTMGYEFNGEFNGFLGIHDPLFKPQSNIVFPCPAIQLLYIKSEEIDKMEMIQLVSIDGSVLSSYYSTEFKNGMIPLDGIPSGSLIVKVYYLDKNVVTARITKY